MFFPNDKLLQLSKIILTKHLKNISNENFGTNVCQFVYAKTYKLH